MVFLPFFEFCHEHLSIKNRLPTESLVKTNASGKPLQTILANFYPLIASSYFSQRKTPESYAMTTMILALTDPAFLPLAVHPGWSPSCFLLQILDFGARAWSRWLVLYWKPVPSK